MRRTASFTPAIAVSALLALGGCSIFGSDKEEAAAIEEAAAQARYEPIETVRDIEVGRTRDGYVITARGYALGLGFSAPELRPRRDGNAGSDGFIDFDFVAQAPDPSFNLGKGTLAARAIRADRQVTLEELKGSSGIRVHGITGGVQMSF